MKKLKVMLGLAVASMLTFTGCVQVVKTEEGKGKDVVATVYGEDITKAELEKRFAPTSKAIEHQYKQQEESDAKLKKEGKEIDTKDQNRLPADKESYIKQQKEGFLSQLTEEKIYQYNADKKKIKVTDEDIDKKLKEQMDMYSKQYGSEEKLAEEIKKYTGFTLDEYKKDVLKENLKIQIMVEKLQEAIIKDIQVTDEEAKTEYDKDKYSYTTEPNKLIFSHILVGTKEEADKVKKELDGGAKIADLAGKYSTDPGSKDNGGKYPDGLEYASLDPAFLEAALKLKPGKISAPVQGQNGFHIIQLHEKKEFEKKPFDSVKEEVKKTLIQSKQMTAVQTEKANWDKEAKVKTYVEKL